MYVNVPMFTSISGKLLQIIQQKAITYVTLEICNEKAFLSLLIWPSKRDKLNNNFFSKLNFLFVA